MSLILPIAQITSRSAPDQAQRSDAPDPAAAPFVQELLQALGGTASAPASSAGELPTTTAPERLDPLGAALRALLGGEAATETGQGEALSVVGAEPQGAEQVQSEEGPAAAELAAELALLLAVAPATTASLGPTEQSDAPPTPVLAPPVAGEQVITEIFVTQSQELVQGLPVTEVAAESLPKPATDSESDPLADGANAGGAKVTAKAPTFDDLVQLVTETQSRDTARHTPKQPDQEPQGVTESVTETAPQVRSAPTQDGEPQAANPIGERVDGPKPHFAELLPTQAAEPRSGRSVEIPAPALLNQVTRSIRLLAEGARSELQVKLHPAELGEVLVRLTIQDGLLTAHLQTSDAAVKATLDANLDALRARFEQHGLQVNSLAVSTGAGQLTDDGQAKSGWSQPSNQSTGRGSSDDGEGEEPNGPTEPTPVRRILGRRGLSRLDHLA